MKYIELIDALTDCKRLRRRYWDEVRPEAKESVHIDPEAPGTIYRSSFQTWASSLSGDEILADDWYVLEDDEL